MRYCTSLEPREHLFPWILKDVPLLFAAVPIHLSCCCPKFLPHSHLDRCRGSDNMIASNTSCEPHLAPWTRSMRSFRVKITHFEDPAPLVNQRMKSSYSILSNEDFHSLQRRYLPTVRAWHDVSSRVCATATPAHLQTYPQAPFPPP